MIAARRRVVIVLAASIAVLAGCGRRVAPPTPTQSFAVDTSYGTLSFHGTIDRADRGSEYEYRTHLDVTFHPDRPINRTPVVDLIAYQFVASVPAGANEPVHLLHEETRPISVHLERAGQSAHLPDMRFRLSKATVAQAHAVLIGVLDGHWLWPIPVYLQ